MNDQNSLFVNIGKTKITYRIHPVVVFSILDHYKRRSEDQKRVVGTLLGEQHGLTVVIKNSFPIPHSEGEHKVSLDMEFHNTMIDLHKRINPKEVVVGWYSTSDELTFTSTLIHQVYAQQCASPVHITLDTALTNWRMSVKAFTAKSFRVGDKEVMARFEHAKLELDAYEAEKIGVDALINAVPEEEKLDAPATVPSEFENLEHSLTRLLHNIDSVASHVEKVVKGEVAPDAELGRQIADALGSVPEIDAETFDHIFNNNMQDLLMVLYLSNLTRTQLALAEKIEGLI